MNRQVILALAGLVFFAIAMTAVAQETTTVPEEATTTLGVIEDNSVATTTDASSLREREERSVPSTESTSTETTTEIASDETVPSATTTPESTPVTQEEPATETLAATPEDVPALEDNYFSQHGKYLQILPGNQLPDYETGTVAGKLGTDIDAGVRVDVYVSPSGAGYQVTYEENGTIYTVGFGPEAESRTYSYAAPIPPSATSTSPAL